MKNSNTKEQILYDSTPMRNLGKGSLQRQRLRLTVTGGGGMKNDKYRMFVHKYTSTECLG